MRIRPALAALAILLSPITAEAVPVGFLYDVTFDALAPAAWQGQTITGSYTLDCPGVCGDGLYNHVPLPAFLPMLAFSITLPDGTLYTATDDTAFPGFPAVQILGGQVVELIFSSGKDNTEGTLLSLSFSTNLVEIDGVTDIGDIGNFRLAVPEVGTLFALSLAAGRLLLQRRRRS